MLFSFLSFKRSVDFGALLQPRLFEDHLCSYWIDVSRMIRNCNFSRFGWVYQYFNCFCVKESPTAGSQCSRKQLCFILYLLCQKVVEFPPLNHTLRMSVHGRLRTGLLWCSITTSMAGMESAASDRSSMDVLCFPSTTS